jgi:hypothetical protein
MGKILLGKVRDDYKGNHVAGEKIYLSKHSWDCGWYWGFGYVGNKDLHTHFDSAFLTSETDIKKIFEETKITQSEWWLLRDLFIQAYALKNCAEVYRYGGHQTSKTGITDIIKNDELAKQLNKDLETVLNKIWEMLIK